MYSEPRVLEPCRRMAGTIVAAEGVSQPDLHRAQPPPAMASTPRTPPRTGLNLTPLRSHSADWRLDAISIRFGAGAAGIGRSGEAASSSPALAASDDGGVSPPVSDSLSRTILLRGLCLATSAAVSLANARSTSRCARVKARRVYENTARAPMTAPPWV